MTTIYSVLLGLFLGYIQNTHVSSAQFLVADMDLLDASVSLSVDISLEHEQARLVIRGPANSWFGVGFGNNVMNGTYAILAFTVDIFEIGTIPVVEEVILGHHWNGFPQFNQSLFILADFTDGFHRTLVLQRHINGPTFSFPRSEGEMDLIVATGLEGETDYTIATAMGQREYTKLLLEQIEDDPIATEEPVEEVESIFFYSMLSTTTVYDEDPDAIF